MDGALKTARYDPEQGHRHGGRGGRGRGGRGGRGRGRGRGNRKFRLPGNIKERPEDVLPGELKLATELLLRVADFSAYSTGEENDLVTNIMTITRPLIQLGDLARLPDDMSKLFIQCLTHLPLQIPVVATVLGLINTTNTYHDFVMLVVNNLSLQLEHSLNEINIPKAKLILRSLACLAACGTVSTDSFVLLLSNIYDSLQLEISENMPMHNVIVLYLLTSTIPWCINTVKQTSNGLEFIQKLNDYCIKHVLSRDANYVSTYSVEGKHAVFFINCLNDGEGEDGDGMSSEAVGDIDVWDTLQRLCMVCREMCSAEAHANTPASPFILDVWKHFSEQLHSTTTFEDVDMLPDVDIDEVTVEDTRTHVIQIDIVATAYAQSSEDESDIRQASLTSSSITEYIRNGIQLHRSDMFYTDVENRERRDRNPCVGSWLSFLYPIFDTTSQDASIASLGQLSHIDRCIVSDYIRDIIVFFEPYIRNDGTYLGSTVTLAQHLLSIHKIYAFNSVTEISSGVEHRVCVTDMNVMQSATECLVVETIFQMLLQIPTYKPLCLHRIILELCRLAPAVIPRLVASACIVLYQLAPAMDTTSWKSITTWLSYQLVNFKLSWPYWDYWATEFNTIDDSNYASEEQKLLIGPQHDTSKAFILDVVDKTSRLSFPTAMKAVLPSSLHVCIPQQDVSNNVANAGSVLLYSCLQMGPVDSASLGAVATTTMELYQKMSTNYSQDDVENWLDEVEIDAPECWKCCALMEIVIFISGGGVILSDISANLDKFTALLRSYSYNVDDGQKAMLDTLYHIYSNCEDWGLFHIVFDMLIRRNIVTCLEAMEWCVGQAHKDIGTNSVLNAVSPSSKHGGLVYQIVNINKQNEDMGHTWAWEHVQMLIDRSYDFVVASVAKKQALIDEMERLSAQIDVVKARRESLGESRKKRRRVEGGGIGAEEEHVEDEVEDDYMDEDYEDDYLDGEGDAVLPLSELQRQFNMATSTLEVVESTMKVAIETSQLVYNVAMTNVLQLINHRCEILVRTEDNQLDAVFVTLCSLIKAILRSYEHHQIDINTNNKQVNSAEAIALYDRADINSSHDLFQSNVVKAIWNKF